MLFDMRVALTCVYSSAQPTSLSSSRLPKIELAGDSKMKQKVK
jgi:hypothetical protein